MNERIEREGKIEGEMKKAGKERVQQELSVKKKTRCISSLIIDVVFIFCSFTLPSLIHKGNIY